MKKFLLIGSLICWLHSLAFTQEKRDYNWILGYDQSLLDTISEVISINFNTSTPIISNFNSIYDFWMEGSNTAMSDREGKLLFYSNGCKIINRAGAIMKNGGLINPGLIELLYCEGGGSPLIQGVLSLPYPGHDSLYFVFTIDFDIPYQGVDSVLAVAPQRVYYQLIDMSLENGLGAVTSQNQIALMDTFSRSCLHAVRHANGTDWWIIIPKSHSNCYFLLPLTTQGLQPYQLKCSGHVWSDDDVSAQSVFSPDTKKYIRFNAFNGLNIFDFDNANGELSNPVRITFPNDTINSILGVAVSSNSKYLYVSARKKLYQFDLHAPDIEASKVLVAVWDGFQNPYSTLFYISALAPDGKIYISNTSSTYNLHVIDKPNCPGLACEVRQHGITLPSYNFATIPNIPHYRGSYGDCDSTSNVIQDMLGGAPVALYPNPANDYLWMNYPQLEGRSYILMIYDVSGSTVMHLEGNVALNQIDISGLRPGTFFYSIRIGASMVSGKFVKLE